MNLGLVASIGEEQSRSGVLFQNAPLDIGEEVVSVCSQDLKPLLPVVVKEMGD